MNATYEKINGIPSLRLSRSYSSKREETTVPLTPEQARQIEVHMGVTA